ncbi:response regulator [Cryptosporangium aurantiacum]|uniref:Two component transcriptional regulator, LuxR family n=1 Tax=Cryptosporangium aurantiacum TaxID=134849 RepID=A0A1M7Q9Y2_9ACTN|nr:response regulator transcription factor [Cryptosporangium aurantiacum]SHN27141.1 two component transcriptional regulator, LuxR family [Cryptosporangium aurantiacum]
MIRVAVVDDHPVFRLGMVALLASLDAVDVVAQAASREEALATIGPDVDVVIMDLHLGDDSGTETTRELVRRMPDVRVLVVTMLEDDESVVASVRAGARGYLLKGATPAEVERAVRAVANGEVILGPQVAARAMTYLSGARTAGPLPFPELTDREREVLDLVARGYDNTTISRRLVLSPKTVRNHVANVLTKLGVPNRSEALLLARDRGLGAAT